MPTLRSQLDALASTFAQQIVAAIRAASVDELVGTKDGGGRQVRGGGGQPDPLSVEPTAKRGENGRLPRRSADEIAALLNKVVLLVKTNKEGLRAEDIRSKLGMLSKEMPRILKEGVAKKKLSAKGRKRATTYFAK